MKLTRKMAVVALSGLSVASFAAGLCSEWYLWSFASRFPDPARGLVHEDSLGEAVTVYLSSTEWLLASHCSTFLYLIVSGFALLSLSSCLSWKFPAKHAQI